MRERKKKRSERSEDRRSPEGVRIIRADEAEEALDTGQAAGRRPEGELRFGDVPPAPEGPRSPHRFPLPDTVDPAAAVPRRPLAPPRRAPSDRPVGRRTARIDPDAAHDPRPWDERVPVPPAPAEAATAEDDHPDHDLADPHIHGVGQSVEPDLGADATEVADADAGVYPPETGAAAHEATEMWPGADAVNDAAPADHPGYDPQAGYEQPAYDPQVGYEQPAYDPQVGYEQPAYDPQAGYEQPAWDPQAGYQQPGWDPNTNPYPQTESQAGAGPQAYEPTSSAGEPPQAVGPGLESSQAPGGAGEGWEPSASWREWQEPAGAPRSEWPATSRAEPPEGSDVWPVAEEDLGDFRGVETGHPPVPDWPLGDLDAGPGQPQRPPTDDQTRRLSVPESVDAQGTEAASVPDVEGEESMPASLGEPAGLGGIHDENEGEDAPSLGLSVARGSTEMPHWTDPPTGEVPRVLSDASEPEGDDLKAWRALGSRATRWRGDGDWDEDVDLGDLGSDESRVGAMDTSLSEQSDLYSFDKEFDALEEERSGAHAAVMDDDLEDFDDLDDLEGAPAAAEPVSVGSARPPLQEPARTTRATRSPSSRNVGGGGTGSGSGPTASSERDLGQAIAVGVGLIVLLIVAYAIGSAALLVLATAVVVACAVEGYGMLQRAGFRPATLLGLVATGGVMFAAYWRGEAALPLIGVILFLATMVWYLWQIVEARPLANVAVTTMTWLWVGLLGSYAALMLRASHGKGLFLGAIIPVIVADIVAYFVGRQIGHRPLAPHISPGKTMEGFLAGGLAAIIAAIIVGKEITPWGGVKHGLLLGIVVALLAPIGDLFESMIKRDLSIKDSGSVLPGHGGLLDRFDAILLVLPAAYYLGTYLGIVH
ncbi:MAG: phosphatidate cytidylyltransferase [Acidimicrobiales bacterium]